MKKQNTGTLRRVLSAIGRYKAPVFASFALAVWRFDIRKRPCKS